MNKYEKHLRSLIDLYNNEYEASKDAEDFVEGVSEEQAAVLSGKPWLLIDLVKAIERSSVEMEPDPYEDWVASMTEDQKNRFGL